MNSPKVALATARQLIKDGLTVYVAARRIEKMQNLEELGAHAIKMDIGYLV